MVELNGKTQICGIIGDPIQHTLSPAMHNAAFKTLNLDYVYIPFRVTTNELEKAILGVRSLNIRGLNVTLPHKVNILPYLDELDSMAENLGAVNTIVNQDGCLKGYNTDAAGFYQALTADGINPLGKRVTILGAGGAGRAVAFILADKGVDLTILNRDELRAQKLADSLMRLFRREVAIGGLHNKNLSKVFENSDIIVNTTSVGMYPENSASPIPSGIIKPGHIVFDIIYNPQQTRLLMEAETSGAKIIGGLEMLVWQGAAAFKLWTGHNAPVEVMRQAALDSLKAGQ